MNIFSKTCFLLVLGLIRLYKWFELGILLLATPLLKRAFRNITAENGIALYSNQVPPDELVKDATPDVKSSRLERTQSNKQLQIVYYSNQLFARVANTGTSALADSFIQKKWDIIHSEDWEELTEFATRVLQNKLLHYYFKYPVNKLTNWLKCEAFNLQTRQRAWTVGKVHYDIGNELFEIMLDPWMQYTCGYWKKATNLNDAQIDKMEMICQKIELKPGMRVLDVGCGWGTLAKYMAEKYGATVVGVTIGKEGAAYGQRVCKGLPVDIRLQDYRDVNEKFDRIVSVGAFEHFGVSNYRKFFKKMSNCLEDDGIFLLHTIGMKYDAGLGFRAEPAILKYIFPNGMLPFETDVTKHMKGVFVIEDWHNFGQDYAKTLYCWRENFLNGWPKLEEKYGGEQFLRMWMYYLCVCRALFLSRQAQLWQVVLSKGGLKREYRAYR